MNQETQNGYARNEALLPPAFTSRRSFFHRAACLLLICGTLLRAAHVSFVSRTITLGGEKYRYALYIPAGKPPKTGWPLIVFLHGIGERGSDGRKQTTVGIGPAIRAHPDWFDCLVLMPQCRRAYWWHKGPMPEMVLAQIDAVVKDFPVDPDRIALTGLSMGGFGTWILGARYVERFSALGPICGGGNVEDAPVLSCLPIWCFHGDADRAVSVERSRRMVKAVEQCGGRIKYTEYPGVGHNCWDRAYGTAEFIAFLKESRRPAPPPLRFKALFAGAGLGAWKIAEAGPGHWKVAGDGSLIYDGKGRTLWTKQSFRDFELVVSWRLPKPGDSGIYLRGSSKSQVNIWCNPLGSGEVWGYRTDPKQPPDVRRAVTPSERMDKPVGQWNDFYIVMQGELLSVDLNGIRVIDHARLPGVPAQGPIALQHHGDPIHFKDIAVMELPTGGRPLFNGKDLTGWKVVGGADDTWNVRAGILRCSGRPRGYLRTVESFSEPYVLSFEWRLLKPGHTGLLLHGQEPDRVWPSSIEVQTDHGSVGNFVKIGNVSYRGGRRVLNREKVVGEWNRMCVACRNGRVEVFVNGAWVSTATECRPLSGFIGLQSEGVPTEWRDIYIYSLKK